MSAKNEGENKCIYCCPFKMIAIPIVLEIIATAMFGIAAFSCKTFVSEATDDITDITDDQEFGYWSYRFRGDCEEYDSLLDDDFAVDEPPLKAGKAFGVIGMTLGGLLFLFMLTFSFISYPKSSKLLFNMCGGVCAFLAVLSALLFVGLANEDFCDDDIPDVTFSCKPNGIGYCAMIAFLFYLAASITILVMNMKGALTPRTVNNGSDKSESIVSPQSKDDQTAMDVNDTGTIITTEQNPDGTYKQTTTKTSITSDGTKFVERDIKTLASAP